MDLEDKLREWLIKMGYIGAIPKNLSMLINPTTCHIWEQLIQKVRPKSEIQQIKNNLIINLIKSKNQIPEDTLNIPEIEVYKHLQKMKRNKAEVEETLAEKETECERLASDNSGKYLKLEQLKQCFEINKEKYRLCREQLLKLKTKEQELKDKISKYKNVLPTEESAANERGNISNDIKKICKESLKFLKSTDSRMLKSQLFNGTFRNETMRASNLNLLDNTFVKNYDETQNLSDEYMLQSVGPILANYVPKDIFKCLEDISESLSTQISRVILDSQIQNSSIKISKKDLFDLQILILKNEFEAMEKENKSKMVRSDLSKIQKQIECEITQSGNAYRKEIITNYIETQQKFAGWVARDDCHKKMLKLQNEQLRNNTNVLHLNEKDLELLKSQFHAKVQKTERLVLYIKDIHSHLMSSLEKCRSISGSLELYINNMISLGELLNSNYLKETSMLKAYNLCINTEYLFRHDIDSSANTDDITFVNNIVQCPSNVPEKMIQDICDNIKEIEAQNELDEPTMQNLNQDITYCDKSLQTVKSDLELLVKKTTVDVFEKLNSLTMSKDVMMSNLKAWTDFSKQLYIAEHRKVNDHPYEYYDTKFLRHYKILRFRENK